MSQLRYDYSKTPEVALKRMQKSFFSDDSKLALSNITTKEKVNAEIEDLQWAIIRREDAVAVLIETEEQVLEALQTKLDDFIRTKKINIMSIKQPPCKNQVRVVIIGGGFSGFTVASILDPMPLFHVTVIDTKDSFEYTPGIIKRLVNPEESSSMRVRHDAYVRNGRVIIGYATKIDDGAKSLQVNGETLCFDYLVIATGSSYASQFKSTDVSVLYRMTGLEQVHSDLLNAKKVLIVGGGLVGCELASEIALRTFPDKHPHKTVTLVDSHPQVINRSETTQRDKAMDYLVDLGIEVVTNERIFFVEGSENAGLYRGTSGRVYTGYDMVFMATGTRPNSQILQNSNDLDCCVDNWGRICVKPTLQINHYKYQHIFAGGDATNIAEEKTGYAATLAGVCIARNICRMVKGKAPLRQGTKGTIPAPDKPLHGISSQGGIGKQKLGTIRRRFAFLNPAWAALKMFDEQQYLKMVQGEAINSTQVFGRMPRRLTLPAGYTRPLTHSVSAVSLDVDEDEFDDRYHSLPPVPPVPSRYKPKQSQSYHTSAKNADDSVYHHGKGKFGTWSSSSTVSSMDRSSSGSSSSGSLLNDFVNNHFQFGSAAFDQQSIKEDGASVSSKASTVKSHHHRRHSPRSRSPRRRSSMPAIDQIFNAWHI
ncbi:FAD/NAD(P)-binding domain-containing protein [Lichtheimia hyalospora FSU 10163]|nr:FAD/NAD(P)-binding domain-containing protein [Lichtheimia hyalospora FSU 10163]